MGSSSFLADERDIHFALFEHQDFAALQRFSKFADHTEDTCKDMLAATLDLCREVFGPLNKVGDREGCHYDKQTLQVSTPPGFKEAYHAYCENGYLNLTNSPDHGGLGIPITLGVAIAELFNAANFAFMMYPGLTRSAAHLIDTHAEPWIAKVCAPKMFGGHWAGTMCLTEPAVGSAVGDLTTKAIPEGDHYRIDGTKQWISGGEHDLTENILHLVLARIEGAPAGMKGVSLFLVPRFRFDPQTGELTGPNDVKCIGIEEKMGIHGNSTCQMRMGEDGGCIGYLIGEANQGINYMFQMMNEARIGVGLQGLSLASVAFLNAEAYAKGRVQGTDVESFKDVNAPRVPIIQHPDVRRMLLRQRSIVEGARALIYTAAFCADMAQENPDEDERARYHGYLELLTPVVKAWCTDMGFDATINALQTYGGYGYTADYPVEQYVRDLKVGSIYEGTNGIQALDLLGRKMRMRGGMTFMAWVQRLNEFVSGHEDHAAIGEEVRRFEEVKNDFAETAMFLAQLGMSGNQREAVLNATPFLMMFGHVTVAYLLLEQAAAAHARLAGASESDQAFYRNKIRTAKFFVYNVLPEAQSFGRVIKSGDRSALDFEFSGE
jgi:hypothetical protein